MVALVLYAALCGSASADVFDDNPAAVSLGPGNVQLFARAADGQIMHRTLNGGAWSNWVAVPGLQAGSGPGRHGVRHHAPTCSRAAPTAPCGRTSCRRAAPGRAGSRWRASARPRRRRGRASAAAPYDLFVRGVDNALWHRALIPGQGWAGWELIGGNLSSAPAAIGFSTVGHDRRLRPRRRPAPPPRPTINGTWQPWSGWGGLISGAPALASPATDVLDVFVRGLHDNALYVHHHGQNTDWARIDATPITSSPAAVSDQPGSIWLFARIDGELFARNVTAATSATPSYGGWISTGPVAPPPVPTPPAPLPPPVTLTPSLTYTYKAAKRSTRLRTLTVKNVAAGATVKVTCSPGCSTKRWTTTPKRSSLSLKKFIRKALRVNAKITVTVWKPGTVASVKTLKIRSRRAPQVTTRCLPPGATTPQRCAT